MKLKTIELSGTALDWAVAMALGMKPEDIYISISSLFRRLRDEEGNLDGRYMTGPDLLFSRKWEAGGPIIEREWLSVRRAVGGSWVASDMHPGSRGLLVDGPTPLIAAMRCYVVSQLGDEVEIPEELLQ